MEECKIEGYGDDKAQSYRYDVFVRFDFWIHEMQFNVFTVLCMKVTVFAILIGSFGQ